MRAKDLFTVLGMSAFFGATLSVIAYMIWRDAYQATSNSFWFSVAGIGLLTSPLSYLSVRQSTLCPQCKKAFSMSKTHQTDIENFVRYKNEPVTENGHTRNKDVPYNVRRYYQHMKCDHCGHQSKYETQEEKKA